MRVYYEFRNKSNNKVIPLALLDNVVAKYMGGQPDDHKFYMPEKDDLSWNNVIQGLLWTSDLIICQNRVEMEELIRQLIENGSLYQPGDTQLYIDLIHYFKHLNLYLYVKFLDQSMFAPFDKNASYMTKDPNMIYTEKEIDKILDYVIDREVFVKNYEIRHFFTNPA